MELVSFKASFEGFECWEVLFQTVNCYKCKITAGSFTKFSETQKVSK